MTETPPTEAVPEVVTQPIKTLAEHVRDALAGDAPLDFAGVKKALKAAGVPLTGKKSVKVDDDTIRAAVADFVLEGRAFKHPSGAKGAERYWSHDEKDRIREAVLTLAATATPFAKLHATAKGLFKGTLPEFAEGIVRELIGEEKLHEHPAKKAGGPGLYATSVPAPPLADQLLGLFGPTDARTAADLLSHLESATTPKLVNAALKELVAAGTLHAHGKGKSVAYATFPSPPPIPLPWYETKAIKKDADKLFDLARKLLEKARETPDNLLSVLRAKLTALAVEEESFALGGNAPEATPTVTDPVADEELGRLIVETVSERKPVANMTIAELRENLPEHYRGLVFDVTVFQLVEQSRVRLYPATIPGQYTSAQSDLFVRDANGHIYTSIGIEG